MTETITVSKFKATCLKVIDQVKLTGIPVIVTKRGEPYAIVSRPPEPKKEKSWIGKYKSEIRITGDIMEPVLDETEWDAMK